MIKEIINLKKKYNGKRLDDNGSSVSREYDLYQNAFIRTMKAIAKDINAEVVKTTKGHYFESVFIERNGKYAYIHYEGIDRTKIDFDENLYCRSAESDKDYVGGYNYFTPLEKLPKVINDILNGMD